MSVAPVRVVTGLGTTQTLAWASTYYLPAMLATPIARDLGVSASTVFAAFSTALILSALIGPRSSGETDLIRSISASRSNAIDPMATFRACSVKALIWAAFKPDSTWLGFRSVPVAELIRRGLADGDV